MANHPLNTRRLDSFLGKMLELNKNQIRLLLAQNKVSVDGHIETNRERLINTFSVIIVDGQVIQNNPSCYLMLNKQIGVVSATQDHEHQTVIDLINHNQSNQLHIVGRLDKNTSGLVLLTNDSRWSEKLTSPVSKVEKHYTVTLKHKLSRDYVEAFDKGMYFGFENITTQPAKLEIVSDYQAKVILTEGKYHQIKRMFGRFRNPVVALHREKIGNIKLDESLNTGEWRTLSNEEVLNAT